MIFLRKVYREVFWCLLFVVIGFLGFGINLMILVFVEIYIFLFLEFVDRVKGILNEKYRRFF